MVNIRTITTVLMLNSPVGGWLERGGVDDSGEGVVGEEDCVGLGVRVVGPPIIDAIESDMVLNNLSALSAAEIGVGCTCRGDEGPAVGGGVDCRSVIGFSV